MPMVLGFTVPRADQGPLLPMFRRGYASKLAPLSPLGLCVSVASVARVSINQAPALSGMLIHSFCDKGLRRLRPEPVIYFAERFR